MTYIWDYPEEYATAVRANCPHYEAIPSEIIDHGTLWGCQICHLAVELGKIDLVYEGETLLCNGKINKCPLACFGWAHNYNEWLAIDIQEKSGTKRKFSPVPYKE